MRLYNMLSMVSSLSLTQVPVYVETYYLMNKESSCIWNFIKDKWFFYDDRFSSFFRSDFCRDLLFLIVLIYFPWIINFSDHFVVILIIVAFCVDNRLLFLLKNLVTEFPSLLVLVSWTYILDLSFVPSKYIRRCRRFSDKDKALEGSIKRLREKFGISNFEVLTIYVFCFFLEPFSLRCQSQLRKPFWIRFFFENLNEVVGELHFSPLISPLFVIRGGGGRKRFRIIRYLTFLILFFYRNSDIFD